MGNIQDIIRIFSANILLAAKEDLSVKILAETLIINGLGGHQPIKEMTINKQLIILLIIINNKLIVEKICRT